MNTQLVPAVAFVRGLASQLVNWLASPGATADPRIAAAFGDLTGAIEALPPCAADLGQMCYFRNRARSSRDLWEAGDRLTALYQMREFERKCSRLEV